MTETELQSFKREVILAIQTETHSAIKDTGSTWVVEAVERAVPLATEALFIKFGIDTKNPIELQKDFAYLRGGRIDSEDRRKTVMQTLTRQLTTFCVSAITASIILWLSLTGKS